MLKLVQKGINIMVKQGLIKPVNSKSNLKNKKNKTIKTKNPMKAKYSTFKQKSIINRQISNSRNFFKKEDN